MATNVNQSQSRIPGIPLLAIALMALIATCARAADQNYDELPRNEKVQKFGDLAIANSDLIKAMPEMLSGAQPLTPAFDQFFSDMFFPLFAQWRDIKGPGGKMISPLVDTGAFHSPAKMRTEFKQYFASKASNAGVREHLNKLTLDKMDQIASGNFHPVCRANAMMMIADLDDPNSVPCKKALPVLLNALTAPTSIDAVRVPALRGLLRQAQAGIPAANQPAVIAAMLALQAQRTPPADRTQDGQDWICRRAIDVLAAMGNPGTAGAVPAALMKTVDDQTASLAVRSAAAAALASINYPPPPGFNAEPWIKSLGKLAVDCYKGELAAAATQQAPLATDRLKQELNQDRLGLIGPDGQHGLFALAAANKANQELARLFVAQIDNVIAKCSAPVPAAGPPQIAQGTSGEQYMVLPPDAQKPLVDAIIKAGEELETALQRGPGAAPAAPGPGTPAAIPAGQNPF